MNFKGDIVSTIKKLLDLYDIEYSDCTNEDDVIRRYKNVQLKLIKPAVRSVITSNNVKSSPLYSKYSESLREITRKSRAGEDLNGFLSKTIFKKDYTDSLFYDWGIYHFHLGEIEPENYFVKRSDHLLFLLVTEDGD